MIRALALLALVSAPAVASIRAPAAPALVAFGAEGGDFRAELSDGQVLHGADLVGAELRLVQDGTPFALRIDSAERDAGGHASDVWLFRMSFAAPDGTRQDFCEPDPDGRSLAIPYAADDQPGGFAITCSSGAVGKCMRFGYRPWARSPDGAVSLAPFHAACVNMVRGAYAGPERAFTRNGMRIDLYDRIGIQTPDLDPAQAFEAGWTPAGAVCVAHPRVPENGSLAAIVAAGPFLAGHTGPEVCNEAEAQARGALLFNRSSPPRRG